LAKEKTCRYRDVETVQVANLEKGRKPMTRHAEIAGGGIAGLGLAGMLAAAGWSVRVHETSAEIRETGAGIYMRNNSLQVFEEYGIDATLEPQGSKIVRSQFRDRHGRINQEFALDGLARLHVYPRQVLIEELEQFARANGAEIVLESTAAAAEPDGVLVMADGRRLEADLVVAADGGRSKVRDSVITGATHRELGTRVNRHFITNRNITPEPMAVQHWSGRKRIGVAPTGDSATYVYLVMPAGDRRATELPLDVDVWSDAFPALRQELEEIAATPIVTQFPYSIVRCPRWHLGKVAVIGDAATGLPPTLGQGAGLAIMNARALALALDRVADVTGALAYWEQEVRFISDTTQLWSYRYDQFSRGWPAALNFLRPPVMWFLRHGLNFNERMRIADRGLGITALHP
jgi:2-polyprenyl-6-methoxyphenol hydroxylase-like FAD-dependent oxidoreductase